MTAIVGLARRIIEQTAGYWREKNASRNGAVAIFWETLRWKQTLFSHLALCPQWHVLLPVIAKGEVLTFVVSLESNNSRY
jgi:hypothetical protein